MQVITPNLIQDKKVLLRLDFDIPLEGGRIMDDFRLKAVLPTLKLCLENAQKVIIMGHLGRPNGKEVPGLCVAPIYDWLKGQGFSDELENGKLKLLENLRFEKGEVECSLEYANKLAQLGNFYINEAFAAYHPASSTTVLPTLLSYAAGLRFAQEVEVLTEVRENPKRPLVVVIGGAKVEDKLPAVLEMAKRADWVLVGGKIVAELSTSSSGHEKPLARTNRSLEVGFAPNSDENPNFAGRSTVPHFSIAPDFAGLPPNVLLGKLNKTGADIIDETVLEWEKIIRGAKTLIWNGPLGKVEDPENDKSRKIAQTILNCQVFSVVGGGDTVGYLGKIGLLEEFEKKGFVSTGGGAMLKFLVEGTLPSIEALK